MEIKQTAYDPVNLHFTRSTKFPLKYADADKYLVPGVLCEF